MITGFGTSLQTRCLLQPDVLPKYQATHTLNGFLEVRGMAHTQTSGFPTLIYQPLGLTSLPPDLLSSDSSPAMATKSRDWRSSASLFDGYEFKSLVLLGLRHSSTSADTHSQVDLRRSSRLSVRIIRLFQSPVWVPFIERLGNSVLIPFPLGVTHVGE